MATLGDTTDPLDRVLIEIDLPAFEPVDLPEPPVFPVFESLSDRWEPDYPEEDVALEDPPVDEPPTDDPADAVPPGSLDWWGTAEADVFRFDAAGPTVVIFNFEAGKDRIEVNGEAFGLTPGEPVDLAYDPDIGELILGGHVAAVMFPPEGQLTAADIFVV